MTKKERKAKRQRKYYEANKEKVAEYNRKYHEENPEYQRQKGDSEGNEGVNPLSPYFLVYIRDDGAVRYNYTNAKQILEIYRLLCQGRRSPYDKLCELFNDETENGEKMDRYSDLLKKAVSEIIRIFKRKGNQKLTSDRGALLIPKTKQLNEMEDFELITWLIVR